MHFLYTDNCVFAMFLLRKKKCPHLFPHVMRRWFNINPISIFEKTTAELYLNAESFPRWFIVRKCNVQAPSNIIIVFNIVFVQSFHTDNIIYRERFLPSRGSNAFNRGSVSLGIPFLKGNVRAFNCGSFSSSDSLIFRSRDC